MGINIEDMEYQRKVFAFDQLINGDNARKENEDIDIETMLKFDKYSERDIQKLILYAEDTVIKEDRDKALYEMQKTKFTTKQSTMYLMYGAFGTWGVHRFMSKAPMVWLYLLLWGVIFITFISVPLVAFALLMYIMVLWVMDAFQLQYWLDRKNNTRIMELITFFKKQVL